MIDGIIWNCSPEGLYRVEGGWWGVRVCWIEMEDIVNLFASDVFDTVLGGYAGGSTGYLVSVSQ